MQCKPVSALANEIRESKKELWLFDCFQGLPPPTEKDKVINDIFGLGSIEKYTGMMASPVESVKGRLDTIHFPRHRTHIVPGFIEKTVRLATRTNRVCFLCRRQDRRRRVHDGGGR
jgi:O-methyltransferase